MRTQNIVVAAFLLILAIGVFLGIESYRTPPARIETLERETNDLELLLRVHGNCPNGCASYTIHIIGNGEIGFVGEEFTRVIDGVDGHVDDQGLFLIGSAIHDSRFLEWTDVEECRAYRTHSPYLLTWVKWQGKEKKDERDLGCINQQTAALWHVLKTVEDVVDVRQWIDPDHRGPAISSVLPPN
jgi:hypothetical protein